MFLDYRMESNSREKWPCGPDCKETRISNYYDFINEPFAAIYDYLLTEEKISTQINNRQIFLAHNSQK